MHKTTFVLFFGNRGFFPGELIATARQEMIEACVKNNYDYLIMEESLTRYGAVETIKEGALFAEFLEKHKGEYDGIILSLPNFGDENGAAVALKNIDVPILVQAFPDEIDNMDFAHRRDAMCGKLAMCNVLRQLKIKYTLTKDFCVNPLSDAFAKDLRLFAATCRVVKGMKQFNVGAIGARTTAFKTVRYDEIAFQSHRINVESIDMSRVFEDMTKVDEQKLEEKKKLYAKLSNFGTYPSEKLENISRLGVVIDQLIEEYDLQAIAIRCWDELEKKFGIAPCLILGELNERSIAAACELDVTNAVMMRAMCLASDHPVMLLDVNNNYGDETDKVIFFHCGPAPVSMMREQGHIEEHLMFRKSFGEGTGVGINKGKLMTGDVTVGSFKTENGDLCAFVTEGQFTDEELQKEFFGCGAVFEKKNAGAMLKYMAENGYRHHVCIAKGNYGEAVKEAFHNYLGYKIDIV
jgi:L-fucose isomerase, C-terminal domain